MFALHDIMRSGFVEVKHMFAVRYELHLFIVRAGPSTHAAAGLSNNRTNLAVPCTGNEFK
jgi:hypothetical protein